MSDLFTQLQKQYEPTTTYFEICKNVVKPAIVEIGATRDSCRLLSGLRFHVVGHFSGTTAKALEDTITRLGGEVLSKDKALGLSKRHSSTPNCFVVLKNDTELLRATWSEQCAASESDSDTCTSTTQRKPAASKTMKKAAAQGTARICREFAATDFKFIKVTYIEDVEKKAVFWILPNT